MIRHHLVVKLLPLLLVLCSPSVHAQMSIDVVGGEGRQIPIAILPFAGDDARMMELQMRPAIARDLAHSGWFRVVEGEAAQSVTNLDFAVLKAAGAQVALTGAVKESRATLETAVDLIDVGKRASLLDRRFVAQAERQRHTAHRIADLVLETLTGRRGAFATRICYVARDGERSELVLADADGFDREVIYAANAPIVSPQWSPDGQHIVYVSLEQKKPVVYVHHVVDGSRSLLARFHGSNFSPSWSADGHRLALALSKDGGSQIYSMNADGSELQQVLNSRSRDSEPNFSPDGRRLLFTSDRSGSPQIYEMILDSIEAPRRLTFEGNYNTSPRYSPNGRGFAFVHFSEGRFNIAFQDLATGQARILTSGHDDRSPSFAPNGDALLYTAQVRDGSVLSAVTTDGRVHWTIPTLSHSIRTPAWGPFNTSNRGD
jgi:TolB protein